MNVARLLNMTLPFVPCSFTVNPARVAACECMDETVHRQRGKSSCSLAPILQIAVLKSRLFKLMLFLHIQITE